MAAISKREADAYDRVLEAADALAELIESGGIAIDEYVLEELSLFLVRNAVEVRQILNKVKHRWSPEGATATVGEKRN